jgi:hypothetical protein
MSVTNSHVPTLTQFLKKLAPAMVTAANEKAAKLVERAKKAQIVYGYGVKIIDQDNGYTLVSVYVTETKNLAYCRIEVQNWREENVVKLEVAGKGMYYDDAIEAALIQCFDNTENEINPVNGFIALANVYFPARRMLEVRF